MSSKDKDLNLAHSNPKGGTSEDLAKLLKKDTGSGHFLDLTELELIDAELDAILDDVLLDRMTGLMREDTNEN